LFYAVLFSVTWNSCRELLQLVNECSNGDIRKSHSRTVINRLYTNCIDIISKGLSYRICGLEKIDLASKMLKRNDNESVLHSEIKHEKINFCALSIYSVEWWDDW
jgi:hypothetical protein